jgi:thiol-disulfide isomerase/thioredoxin
VRVPAGAVAAISVLVLLGPIVGTRAGETEGPLAPGGPMPELHYFWANGCPVCARAAAFLDELEQDFPYLQIVRYEVQDNRDNLIRYRSMAKDRGVPAGIVPAFFLGDRSWRGFNDSTKQEITEALQVALDPDWSESDQSAPGLSRTSLTLPIFGRIEFATVPAFVVTGAIAAVDGLNPCSLWVLTFLIGLIIRSGSRRRTATVGCVFLMVTALVYGLFILGLFTVFTATAGIVAIRVLVAVLAVSMGLINMKDYFAFKIGFSLTIPSQYHSVIARLGRSVSDSGSAMPALVMATIVFAFGISVIELPCTAGFPVIWSQYIATLDLAGGTFALLFVLYLMVYLGLEIVVVVMSVLFMKRLIVSEKYARLLKLFGGAIMVVLGVVYLGFPGMTQTLGGVGRVFVFATGLGVLCIVTVRLVRKARTA